MTERHTPTRRDTPADRGVLSAYVGAFVEELARGLRHVVFCPGSRSTPLALLFAKNRQVRMWRHIDERPAGFFALGMAKTLREPVALVCSSGTAAANFLPAVVEARYARVPLLILSADRPHELRDVGAPQAIDQLQLYGSHAKWFCEMAIPEATPSMLRYVKTTAGRALAAAAAAPAGPVHLNFPFREPLVPAPYRIDEAPGDFAPLSRSTGADALEAAPARAGRPNGLPYVSVSEPVRLLPDAEAEALADELAAARRPLLVCGPQDDSALPEGVARLADVMGIPILADPLSGVRCGTHDRRYVIDRYDAMLRDGRFAEAFAPDFVLRTGAMPTSKALLRYFERHPHCRHVVIDDVWNEPTGLAGRLVHADAAPLFRALADRLDRGVDRSPFDPFWSESWLEANQIVRRAIRERLAAMDRSPFEGRLFAEMAARLPAGSTLYVGNSMPVRDLDTFFPSRAEPIRLLANRGANGIDGVVSSALGAAAAGSNPLVLAIGDLSFYHDMNGLLAAKLHQLSATIVVVHNDGGGIFSFLPQAEHPEHFEELFGTPTGLDFRPAVEMYGGVYHEAAGWDVFADALESALSNDGLDVIALNVAERTRNVALHRSVWEAVSESLEAVLPKGLGR